MTTQRKARGAYSVGQATRESILSAAMVLIAERGYNGFSLRDLGRRVGISHPAVVYHFPSKEAILRSAIQRHEEMNVSSTSPLTMNRKVASTRAASPQARLLTGLSERCASP